MDDGVLHQRLVGVSFYQSALEGCSPGQAVKFVHEPDNPYDEMAIRVETDSGQTIGYVPRSSPLRTAVHEHGRGLSGAIASLGYGRACLLGVTITVALCDDEPAVASYYPDAPAPEPPHGGFRYWINSPSAAERFAREKQALASPTRSPRPLYPRRSASAG